MQTMQQQFAARLREAGSSLTSTRITVFEILERQGPVTMGELVRASHGSVDRASVYRIIELFESLGIVQRLQLGWKYKLELSDDFVSHHHHLSCTHCGSSAPFHETQEVEQALQQIADVAGFAMHSHQLEIRGLCAQCHAKVLT